MNTKNRNQSQATGSKKKRHSFSVQSRDKAFIAHLQDLRERYYNGDKSFLHPADKAEETHYVHVEIPGQKQPSTIFTSSDTGSYMVDMNGVAKKGHTNQFVGELYDKLCKLSSKTGSILLDLRTKFGVNMEDSKGTEKPSHPSELLNTLYKSEQSIEEIQIMVNEIDSIQKEMI